MRTSPFISEKEGKATAWIELHQAVRDHRKTQALAECLGMPEPHVVGHLVYLWLWALDNAPDGAIPDAPRTIAKASQWAGDATTWLDALVSCGFVDCSNANVTVTSALRNGGGNALRNMTLHDWSDYSGKLLAQRRSNADRQQRWRDRKKTETVQDSGHNGPNISGDSDLDSGSDSVTVTLPLRNATPRYDAPYRERVKEERINGVSREGGESERGTKSGARRIPDDFAVTEAMAAFAERLGLPPSLVETETEKFLDHFRAKGERKTDWVAAWRNWMRRIGEFQPAPARSRPMNGVRPPAASSSTVVTRSDGPQQRRIMGRD